MDNKDDYYSGVNGVSQRGDWDIWIPWRYLQISRMIRLITLSMLKMLYNSPLKRKLGLLKQTDWLK
jgi:hypothetical protein